MCAQTVECVQVPKKEITAQPSGQSYAAGIQWGDKLFLIMHYLFGAFPEFQTDLCATVTRTQVDFSVIFSANRGRDEACPETCPNSAGCPVKGISFFFFCQGLPARPLCQTDVLPKQEDGDKERKKKEREGMEKVKTELRRIDFHHLALPYCLDSSSDYQWMILKINAEANKRLTDGRFAKGSYLHAAMLQSLTLLE